MQHATRFLILTVGALALGVAATTVAGAQVSATRADSMRTESAQMDSMSVVDVDALAWTDANIPGFNPGMKIAVVHGNPEAAGPYTLRLSFPDGYRFPAHWHPNAENLTVLSGAFLLGMGERVNDAQLKTYSAGDYLNIPPRMAHFGGASGPTVIQLHGEGPFAITVVSDTTKKKK